MVNSKRSVNTKQRIASCTIYYHLYKSHHDVDPSKIWEIQQCLMVKYANSWMPYLTYIARVFVVSAVIMWAFGAVNAVNSLVTSEEELFGYW